LHAAWTAEDRVYLALPLVAFADKDVAWLLAESRFASMPELMAGECWKWPPLIATVASALCLVPRTPPSPLLVTKIEDNALTTSIGSTIDGIGKLLESDLEHAQ
jgi:hypothetical protein